MASEPDLRGAKGTAGIPGQGDVHCTDRERYPQDFLCEGDTITRHVRLHDGGRDERDIGTASGATIKPCNSMLAKMGLEALRRSILAPATKYIWVWPN
jgi:hypothetical protein